MFRNMSNEGHFSGGQTSTSAAGHGVTSPGLGGQESSWIGLLSVVSRPALAFLQKYVTGRTRNQALSESGSTWIGADLQTSFVDEEREFLRQLDDMQPAPHLTYLRYQYDGAPRLLEPRGGGTLSWLTAESLQEIGIQSAEEMQNGLGRFSSVRTFFSHVLLSPSQEVKSPVGKDWVTEAVGSSPKTSGTKIWTWWGSLWGGEQSLQKGLLSDLSQAEDSPVTGQLCSQCPETKAPAAKTSKVFVQRGSRESMLGENTGPADHKEELADNGGLHTVENTEGSTPDHHLSISDRLSSSGAATTCSEVALLTPDQDNGYSSLEEEHIQMCHLCVVKTLNDKQQEPGNSIDFGTEMVENTSEDREPGNVDEEAGMQEDDQTKLEGQSMVLPTPQCQNKAIAFIMGCPCSDDDSSDDDDDEASPSDNEASMEAERLWSSLCQSPDPYNPQNFTARLYTGSTPHRAIPIPTPPSSTQASPTSSPELTPLSHSDHDVWDDSTSASEVDEAESLRLWSSFNCSSDPYSPFNFQAPLRTRAPAEAVSRAKARAKKASQRPSHSPYCQLDSGFSEPSSCSMSSTTQSHAPPKKVSFCGEDEEDRRGPWEELARDRCRFLRRCQEVEQSIAYCLQPQHRSLVYRRLTVLSVQDA
uniref:Protein phosphatase 1 regulatory subunit 15B-like n=1 Tax=Mastacembelus armatus TaxID=205130 RepID=A0A7N8XDJ8_9TELE